MSSDVIVLPGLEVGNAGGHMVAAGVRKWIDWRLPADEAIEAVHRQGGVALAAHPIRKSWVTRNALRKNCECASNSTQSPQASDRGQGSPTKLTPYLRSCAFGTTHIIRPHGESESR